MAIYKNREVTVTTPTARANPPSTIVVQYADGSYETVSISNVYFTEDEKKALVKNYPSEYDSVNVASEDDVKAVRVGVAPASDPDRKAQAEAEVKAKEARELDEKLKEQAKDEVKDEPKPTPVSPVVNSVKAK